MTPALARQARTPTADIIVESPLWAQESSAEETVRRAIAQAVEAIDTANTADAELAVVLTDDASIQALNRRWRGLDKPTNVLSFPAAPSHAGSHVHLGDIVIAYETTAREARAENRPLAHHLAHLAVHGFLHLMGYDHESEPEAEAMERLERAILSRLDVPDPYLTHETGV